MSLQHFEVIHLDNNFETNDLLRIMVRTDVGHVCSRFFYE